MTTRHAVYFVFIFLLIATGLWVRRIANRAPDIPEGMTIDSEPQQDLIKNGKSWTVGEYTFSPTASYVVRARVLRIEEYRYDREAEFSPADWVLGWKRMSDSSILKRISISQAARTYEIRGSPIPEDEIIANSANTHILPGNPEVAKRMKSVRVDDIIRARGYLVNINSQNDYLWTTSLSRTDKDRKGGEIFWVEHLGIEVP